MNIYDLLNSTAVLRKRFDLNLDFPNEAREELDTPEEKRIYDLIKNICSMAITVTDAGVEFGPAWIFDGKKTYSLEDISEEDYAVLISLDYQKLPINVRARITDVLWTQKKKYTAGVIAAETYYELFNLLFKEEDWLIAMRMIKRATCIALQINKSELHVNCCKTIYDHLIRIDGADEGYLSIILIEFLLKNSFGDLNKIVAVLDNILALSRSDPGKMERAFELKFKCINKLKGLEEAKVINIDMATYLVAFGEQIYNTDKQSAMRSVPLFQKAIFLFRNNGEPERAEQTHRQLVKIQKDITKSMMVHKQKIDASELIIRTSEFMEGFSFEESIVRLSQLTHLYTKKEGEEDLTKELTQHPIMHMFETRVINSEGQTVFSLEPLDIEDPYKNAELLDLHINHKLFELEDWSGNLHLRFALNYIRENFDVAKQNFDFLLDDNAIVPLTRKSILKTGIRLAIEGDYYAAVHILAPQTENIFRCIAQSAGALTVTLENDGSSKQKTLTSIFDLPELLDCYDNDIIFLFKGLLNEQSGANIRNEIAHGIMEESKGTTGVSVYFICALIKLLVMSSRKCLDMLLDKEKFELSENHYTDAVEIINEEDD